MNQISKSKYFYNKFQNKLIIDYLTQNPRTEKAIQAAKSWIPQDARLLDIGCGLGWSSFEFAKCAQQVVGVDLSDEQVSLAKRIFQAQNLNFNAADVTSDEFILESKFDMITLLDVYEHIPQQYRETFNQSLSELMNDGGLLFLSCPSIHHQDWLRTHNPSALQPVDEDVTVQCLQEIADALNGEIIFYDYQTIWKSKDYFFSVIQKKSSQAQDNLRRRNGSNEPLSSRITRISNAVENEEVDRVLSELRTNRNVVRRLKNRLSRNRK